MSYDLQIVPRQPIDIEAVRAFLLAAEGIEELGDELVWSGTAVTASFWLDPAEVGVGVTSGEAPAEVLRREFRAVLELVSVLASRIGTSVYDVQLGRVLRPGDDEAIRDFAG